MIEAMTPNPDKDDEASMSRLCSQIVYMHASCTPMPLRLASSVQWRFQRPRADRDCGGSTLSVNPSTWTSLPSVLLERIRNALSLLDVLHASPVDFDTFLAEAENLVNVLWLKGDHSVQVCHNHVIWADGDAGE